MTLSARRVVAAVAATMVLAGVFAAGAAPARADSPPKLVTASGSVERNYGYNDFAFTIAPWQLFGFPLGIGTVSGSITGGDNVHSTTTQQCLFGLAWNMRVASTPRRTVTFTCVMIGIVDTLGIKNLFTFNQTVTVVDGPGGSLDGGNGPIPELKSDPIHVTFH